MMAVMLVDSAEFPDIKDEAYVHKAQRAVTTLTPDDLNIFSKLQVIIILTYKSCKGCNSAFIIICNSSAV